ncbi:MAG: SUMF1/EgtB/PvdO family nonheme iron enzyme, partial [Aeromicrobium sp.]|nr:SUMF1/EgtB/PvdO family nonheme iron enzyme [Burkholderiales bacterium]
GVRASECTPPIMILGGVFNLGAADQSFQFDNELPPLNAAIAPFEVDSEPVSAAKFTAWKGQRSVGGEPHNGPACHVSYADASAYAADIGRRLPTEAEWEFAATRSPAFWASSGRVWEWTSSQFAPRLGFVAGPYRDYSTASFSAVAHRNFEFKVLKGGSFATHPRLKYPQYRNFYSTLRNDMFCGFRTCRDL